MKQLERLTGLVVMAAALAVVPVTAMAGDLEPPGAPNSTMVTLQEIYDHITQSCGSGPSCDGAPAAKTGQTTSYRTGDDGDLKPGVAVTGARFTDNTDGTVTDNLTELMWTNDANVYGQIVWNGAIDACAACTVGGYDDWRLPSIKELQTLIDFGRHSPALPSGHPFSNVQPSYYWSSTTNDDYSTSSAWIVSLYCGFVAYYSKSQYHYVWCVRGGPY